MGVPILKRANGGTSSIGGWLTMGTGVTSLARAKALIESEGESLRAMYARRWAEKLERKAAKETAKITNELPAYAALDSREAYE